jgi:hypothetical protein
MPRPAPVTIATFPPSLLVIDSLAVSIYHDILSQLSDLRYYISVPRRSESAAVAASSVRFIMSRETY